MKTRIAIIVGVLAGTAATTLTLAPVEAEAAWNRTPAVNICVNPAKGWYLNGETTYPDELEYGTGYLKSRNNGTYLRCYLPNDSRIEPQDYSNAQVRVYSSGAGTGAHWGKECFVSYFSDTYVCDNGTIQDMGSTAGEDTLKFDRTFWNNTAYKYYQPYAGFRLWVNDKVRRFYVAG